MVLNLVILVKELDGGEMDWTIGVAKVKEIDLAQRIANLWKWPCGFLGIYETLHFDRQFASYRL